MKVQLSPHLGTKVHPWCISTLQQLSLIRRVVS